MIEVSGLSYAYDQGAPALQDVSFRIERGEKVVLLFGPYRGQTLRGVASIDPEYVRTLARSGRSPEVRAAAGRLARVLPLRSSRGLGSGAWPPDGTSASHRGGAWG